MIPKPFLKLDLSSEVNMLPVGPVPRKNSDGMWSHLQYIAYKHSKINFIQHLKFVNINESLLMHLNELLKISFVPPHFPVISIAWAIIILSVQKLKETMINTRLRVFIFGTDNFLLITSNFNGNILMGWELFLIQQVAKLLYAFPKMMPLRWDDLHVERPIESFPFMEMHRGTGAHFISKVCTGGRYSGEKYPKLKQNINIHRRLSYWLWFRHSQKVSFPF